MMTTWLQPLLLSTVLVGCGSGAKEQPHYATVQSPVEHTSNSLDLSHIHSCPGGSGLGDSCFGSNRSGFSSFFSYLFIQYDRDYTEALRIRAEAALIRAKALAESERAKSDALVLLTRETEMQLLELRVWHGQIGKRIEAISSQKSPLVTMEREGRVSADVLSAVAFFAQLGRVPVAELLDNVSVPSLPETEFKSGGSVRVETDSDGNRVFRTTGGKVQAFSGGSLREYLNFIQNNRLQANGNASRKPLADLLSRIYDIGQQSAAAAERQREEIRLQSETKWQRLADLLKEIQSSIDSE